MIQRSANTPSVTDQLAVFAADLGVDGIPHEVRRQVSLLVVDFFRVAAAGVRTPWVKKVWEALSSMGGRPVSRVLYSRERFDPVRAAYMNGVIAGSLDWDDTHVGAMLHPGVVVWPSALAVGEMCNASGKELVPAVAAGYEICIRLGLGMQPGHFQRGFQSTPTCGVFGAAAAAAKLLGLGKDGIRDALGIAASYASGIAQFYFSGSEVKRLHAGKAAAAGVEAALLAHAGLTGPRDGIEGELGFARISSDTFDPRTILKDLGTEYRLMGIVLKPHACSARVQAAVEAACELVAEGTSKDNIQTVEIGIAKIIEGRLTGNAPTSFQEAQVSVPFAVAMALVLETERPRPLVLSHEDFEASLEDPRIVDLSRRTRCAVDSNIEAATSDVNFPARVTVFSRSGGSIRERVVLKPKGGPGNPMSLEEVCARFRAVVGQLYPNIPLDAWIRNAKDLEKMSFVGQLFDLGSDGRALDT